MANKKAVGLDLRADGWTLLEVERHGRAGKDGLEVVNFAQGKWEPETSPEARGVESRFPPANNCRQAGGFARPAWANGNG